MGAVLTAAGLEVHLVLSPHATWANVIAVANGAAFFAYLGTRQRLAEPIRSVPGRQQERHRPQPTDGDSSSTKYYGRCYFLVASTRAPIAPSAELRRGIHLATNAVGLLNRLCYADGNGEPGMPIPTQDVAFQRADTSHRRSLRPAPGPCSRSAGSPASTSPMPWSIRTDDGELLRVA